MGAVLLGVGTFGPFSFVEAAELLVVLGVLALPRARAMGERFQLPFGAGTVIAAAGVWPGLIVVRLVERALGLNLLALRARRSSFSQACGRGQAPAGRPASRARRRRSAVARPEARRPMPAARAADETEPLRRRSSDRTGRRPASSSGWAGTSQRAGRPTPETA